MAMIVQKYKTTCDNCGQEIVSVAGDFSGENEVIIDFLEEMEFTCMGCDYVTIISIDKRTKEA